MTSMRTLLLVLFCVCGLWASEFAINIEKARYLYEIEGDANQAMGILKELQAKVSGQDREHLELLMTEILASQGHTKEARKRFSQRVARSQLSRHHLQKMISRIGLDSIAQNVVLGQGSLGQNWDTLMVWNQQAQLFYGDGRWRIWGQDGSDTQSFQGGRAIFNDGKYIYSLDRNNRLLTVSSLVNGEEESEIPLPSPPRWNKSHGDRLLLWIGQSLWSLRGGKLEWKWNSQVPWCEAIDRQQDDQIHLLCPKNQSLIHLNPGQQHWSVEKMPINAHSAISLTIGLLLISDDQVSLLNPSQHKPLWTINIEDIREASGSDDKVYLADANKVYMLNLRNGQIQASQNVRGHLLVHPRGVMMWKDDGQVQFFDKALNYLWSYNWGMPLRQAPQKMGNDWLLLNRQGQFTLLDGKYNGLLPTQQDIFFQLAEKSLAENHPKDAKNLAKKILALEPGNPGAKWLELKSSEKPATFAELYQSYLLSRSDPTWAKNGLQFLAQSDKAQWVSDLHQQYAAFPKFIQDEKRLWWVHPENNTPYSINMNSGTGKAFNKTLSYPGLANPLDIQEQIMAIVTGKKVDFWALTGSHLGSSPELPETPLWVGLFGHTALRVGRSGSMTFIASNGSFQAYLPGVDQSPVVQILRSGEVLDILYYSGHWMRILPRQKQWVVRNTMPNIDAAWATESALYIATLDQRLLAYGYDGNLIWNKPIPTKAVSIQGDEQHLYLGLSDQKIIAFDRHLGNRLWQYQGSNSLFVRPLVTHNKLYIDQGQSLVVIDALNGKALNTHNFPFRIGPIQESEQSLLITSATGLLFAYPKNAF